MVVAHQGGELVAQLQNQPLGGFEAEAGDTDEGAGVFGRDRAGQRFGFHRGQDGQGDFGADAGHGQKQFKDFLVVRGQEAEQRNFFAVASAWASRPRREAIIVRLLPTAESAQGAAQR